jgi:hypothetical protein
MNISYELSRFLIVDSVSQCFSFLRISLLNSFYSFCRVSSPAYENDFRYWKKALNFTSYERRLNISNRFPSIEL